MSARHVPDASPGGRIDVRRNSPELMHLSIDAVRPCKDNARRHGTSQIEKIKNLIRHYGQVVPIIVDQHGNIIDGLAIWQAMRELGNDEILGVTLTGHSPTELRALRLALNRSAEEAAWDKAALRSELQELVALSFDLDLTGFDAVEIDYILEIPAPQADAAEPADTVSVLHQNAVSAMGDTWVCGRHRVGCGDAQDELFAKKVCGTDAATMAFVDPFGRATIPDPNNAGTPQETAIFGTRPDAGSRRVKYLTRSLAVLKSVCTTNALLYACIKGRHITDLVAAGEACQLALQDLCIWAKPEAGAGSLYMDQHELIGVFQASANEHSGEAKLGQRRRSRSNLWSYREKPSAVNTRLEGTVTKPVALVADAIRDATRRRGVVIDTFLGAGTTIMAAEETGRTCIGIECDPLYVDLAIRRWQHLTKLKAVHADRCEAFDDVAARLNDLREGASHG